MKKIFVLAFLIGLGLISLGLANTALADPPGSGNNINTCNASNVGKYKWTRTYGRHSTTRPKHWYWVKKECKKHTVLRLGDVWYSFGSSQVVSHDEPDYPKTYRYRYKSFKSDKYYFRRQDSSINRGLSWRTGDWHTNPNLSAEPKVSSYKITTTKSTIKIKYSTSCTNDIEGYAMTNGVSKKITKNSGTITFSGLTENQSYATTFKLSCGRQQKYKRMNPGSFKKDKVVKVVASKTTPTDPTDPKVPAVPTVPTSGSKENTTNQKYDTTPKSTLSDENHPLNY